MYQRGGAFARAIELARNVQPELVTMLEEEWGDWYVNICAYAAQIVHACGCNIYEVRRDCGAVYFVGCATVMT